MTWNCGRRSSVRRKTPASGPEPWVRLARLSLETYVRTGKQPDTLPGQDRLYLAGLWNTFQGEERFVILTTAPNDTIIHVHDRMPVLLTDDEVVPWLLGHGV